MADRINKKRGAGQPQVTAQQIIALNPELVKKNGEFVLQKFENGAKGLGEVKIPGEFDADSPFIKTRQSIQKANNIANQAEYDKQVSKKVTEKTDTKVAAELANNGFKPTRENAIFYNRFNALNSTQQQNVLSVIKYCKSQNITDLNKIKARILETFPEINLFDSGKTVPQTNNSTPAFQRKNPVALETFLTNTLKLDLKSETGQMVYERLSSLPQEALNKINAQNFGDLSKANFVEIAHRFEANGIDIRSRQEHQIENNSPRMKAEQEKRELRESASQNIALAYDNAINIIKQYQGNQGWINVGFYREKLGKLLSNVNPTKINTCFDVISNAAKENGTEDKKTAPQGMNAKENTAHTWSSENTDISKQIEQLKKSEPEKYEIIKKYQDNPNFDNAQLNNLIEALKYSQPTEISSQLEILDYAIENKLDINRDFYSIMNHATMAENAEVLKIKTNFAKELLSDKNIEYSDIRELLDSINLKNSNLAEIQQNVILNLLNNHKFTSGQINNFTLLLDSKSYEATPQNQKNN